MPADNTFRLRRGTTSQWLASTSPLRSGEPGYDLSTNILKIGNGESVWGELRSVLDISGIANITGNLLINNVPVSTSGHIHTTSSISNFNAGVSGLLPVKNIVAGNNVTISNAGGVFTINSAGGGSSSNVTRGSVVLTSPSSVFSVPQGYTVGSLDIFLNGIKLSSNGDYTASDGTSFTLSEAAESGSIIEYLALIPGGTSSINPTPLPENIVFTTGNQIINGSKTFNNTIYGPVNADFEPNFIIDTVSGLYTGEGLYLGFAGPSNPRLSSITSSYGSTLSINTSSPGIVFSVSSQEKSRITNNGVGINTTNPAANLHVNGNAIFSSGIRTTNAYINLSLTNNPNNEFRISRGTNSLPMFSLYIVPSGTSTAGSIRTTLITNTDSSIGNNTIFLPSFNGTLALLSDINTSQVTGVLSVNKGGTGHSSYSNGQLLIGSGNSLVPGTLTSGSGIYIASEAGKVTVHVTGSVASLPEGAVLDHGDQTIVGSLTIDGPLYATTKSFKIKHPSNDSMILEYGSLESPYHGIRLTGKDKIVSGVCNVSLPSYLKDLVHEEGINIQITNYQHAKILYVNTIDIQNNVFQVLGHRCKTSEDLEFFWTLTGVRKDIPPLIVEKNNVN